jgi:hypothetical protein
MRKRKNKMDKIDLKEFYKSIGSELSVIKDRVRNLIGAANWGDEGRYKEAILRNCIGRFLPNQYSLGTGFVFVKDMEKIQVTSQIDIIVYDNSYPVLFKEGDFVIVLPHSVRGIIEVKTNGETGKFSKSIEKINNNARMIYQRQKQSKDVRCIGTPAITTQRLFVGLFYYDSKGKRSTYLNHIKKLFNKKENNDELDFDDKCRYFINHISLSDEVFFNFFPNPHGDTVYTDWTVQEGLSKAFFITQLLWYLEPNFAYENSEVFTSIFKLQTRENIILKKKN